jgi:DNA-binding NarL/FixJ family response regulator
MDIRLKDDKDGVQAAQAIRRQVDVPIVYLTAHSDRVTLDRAMGTEYDGFILNHFTGANCSQPLRLRCSGMPCGPGKGNCSKRLARCLRANLKSPVCSELATN